jgi:hypothetical protein
MPPPRAGGATEGPINRADGAAAPLLPPAAAEGSAVSCRFWVAFAAVFLVFVNSGFVGGYTSPVLAVDCGDGSAGGSDGGDVPPLGLGRIVALYYH